MRADIDRTEVRQHTPQYSQGRHRFEPTRFKRPLVTGRNANQIRTVREIQNSPFMDGIEPDISFVIMNTDDEMTG